MWTGRVAASSGQTQGLADQRLRLLPGHALEGSARSRGRGAATLLVGRLARKPVLHRSRTGCPDMDGGRDPDHQRPRGTARVIDADPELRPNLPTHHFRLTRHLTGGRHGWALRTVAPDPAVVGADRKSTRLNSSHLVISYAVFCLKKKTHLELQISDRYTRPCR